MSNVVIYILNLLSVVVLADPVPVRNPSSGFTLKEYMRVWHSA